MSRNPKFWSRFKMIVLALLVLVVLGAVAGFFLMPGAMGRYFALFALIIALNLLLMYFFIRVNDKKRPTQRDSFREEEERKFDFHSGRGENRRR